VPTSAFCDGHHSAKALVWTREDTALQRSVATEDRDDTIDPSEVLVLQLIP
jgi:hypothetical protein